MQTASFFQKVLRVTQTAFIGSHKGTPAVDFGGVDSSKDMCFAPFDARVVRTRRENGEVYIESLEPVLTPSGVKTVNMLFIHDANVKVKQGQLIKKGEHFYTEGGMGAGNSAKFANHVHVEASFGVSAARQIKNASGTWVIPNARPLNEILYLPKSVRVLNSGGIKWVCENSDEKTSKQTYGDEMKIGIYSKTNKQVSSALLKEGAFAIMAENGGLNLYTRRMARQTSEADLSRTFEDLRYKEMQAGEIIAVIDNS